MQGPPDNIPRFDYPVLPCSGSRRDTGCGGSPELAADRATPIPNSADRRISVPQPKALYSYPLLVIHTNEKYWFPVAGREKPRYAHATGTLVVPETYLTRPRDWPPDDLVILGREPTAEEIDRSAALGILPSR